MIFIEINFLYKFCAFQRRTSYIFNDLILSKLPNIINSFFKYNRYFCFCIAFYLFSYANRPGKPSTSPFQTKSFPFPEIYVIFFISG